MTTKVHSKHKLRYWFVCQDCGARRRSARPDTKYCIDPSHSCRKHAQVRRRKEREAVARAQAIAQARDKAEQEQRVREAQDRAKWERERERQRIREEEAAEAAEAAAQEARRKELLAKIIIPRCSTCGSVHWHVSQPQGFFTKKVYLICAGKDCENRVESPIKPAKCKCKSTFFMINAWGELYCKVCKQRYPYGTYPTVE